MISVIIPTLNEAEQIARLLKALADSDIDHEVIVCDGGSLDDTVSIAKQFGATVIASAAGRGTQLSTGAAISHGNTLLFLHADTQLPKLALDRLQKLSIDHPEVVGGNFRVLYDQNSFFCRFVEVLCAFLRTIGIYYGDSGIFVTRQAYDAIGGIKPIEIMEDVDFVLKLERYGKTYCISDTPLITSTRRFKRRSPLGLLVLWARMHILFACGASSKTLAQSYDAKATNDASLER